ncbi:hypothetical protein NC661_12730 [Aquibacillus koreensis]|uniref:DUF4870 domain-containing protein n=1 Tax=Aquibacillus koreensis TaxID=279446 RepID=A0A9X4AIK1_9BACI|nr:hypothetical protein [Aquibacillus koreensis]MCT2537729.1 hypothetical protein [Aquibacillus koreensis]MDC3421237.1 hypothetical protein [Aquibacillus koreensis]
MSENANEVNADQVEMSSEEVKDVEENKAMGILAYLIFFIPLLAAKDSKFAMYHANQGLSLFLVFVAVNIIGTVIPIIGWIFIWLPGYILSMVLLIMGIINAANGKKKPLPVIGKWQLIK